MFDIASFKKRYESARPFVDNYNDRQLRTQVQLTYRDSDECSDGERIIIDEWLTNNSKWLVDNERQYNECLTMLALPKQDIEDLYKAYESLCGGNDGIAGV